MRSCTHRNILYFCSGRGQQQRLRLALARLERGAGVAHLARELQHLEPGQRFVDHHRPQLGRLEHRVLPVGREVARGRLLQVLHAVEALGRLRLHLMLEIEDVLDVRTALVEVDASRPNRGRRASPAPRS